MSTPKPTMLIAEDSLIADWYNRMFGEQFDVTVARTGVEAFRVASEHARFDICIIDIIMPVESPDRSLQDADTTGLRLIEYLLRNRKAKRILVLTVRGDVKVQVDELVGECRHAFLCKVDTCTDEILATVQQLMADGHGSNAKDLTVRCIGDELRTLRAALDEGASDDKRVRVCQHTIVKYLRHPSVRNMPVTPEEEQLIADLLAVARANKSNYPFLEALVKELDSYAGSRCLFRGAAVRSRR